MRKHSTRYREWQHAYTSRTTGRTRAIAASLVALFPLLPNDGWRRQFAAEILASPSGQTLTWACTALEELIVEFTEAE